MNACEAEILEITKLKPRKKYKDRDEYLIHLLRAVDGLPSDKFEYLLSQQTYNWYEQAAKAFKAYKPLPELPDTPLNELRYPRDEEDYTPPQTKMPSTEEHRGNIQAMLEAKEKADKALEELKEATDKVKPKRHSKYRQPEPHEGARYYLFPELDRYGLLLGSQRQKAAEMFERGATMNDVKAVTGYTMYNLLRRLKELGHQVENAGGIIKLTHKDDIKPQEAKNEDQR